VEGKAANLVLLEIKHTQGALNGDPLKQMQDNVALLNAEKVKRIEYVFSTEDAAKANQNNVITHIYTPP
jgi:hypothetical protein